MSNPQYPEPDPTYVASTAPVSQLKSNRSLLKYILFSIITLGIYSIVFFDGIGHGMNVLAGRYDGKKTMNFWLLILIIAPITLGIGYWVWLHKLSARMGLELQRRNIRYAFDASSFWLWYVLGSFIIVGPFVYLHKIATASNMLAAHYNING
jgi:hypothetical protein